MKKWLSDGDSLACVWFFKTTLLGRVLVPIYYGTVVFIASFDFQDFQKGIPLDRPKGRTKSYTAIVRDRPWAALGAARDQKWSQGALRSDFHGMSIDFLWLLVRCCTKLCFVHMSLNLIPTFPKPPQPHWHNSQHSTHNPQRTTQGMLRPNNTTKHFLKILAQKL